LAPSIIFDPAPIRAKLQIILSGISYLGRLEASAARARGNCMAKGRTGLDHRHRDKSGRIERKHGDTKVAALRKEYGPGFAKGRRKDLMLKTLLKETDSASLHDYLKHHYK
jgi:hypothetical protein